MGSTAQTLVTVGGLLIASLAVERIGRRTRLPRVSLLLLVGVVAGPLVLDLLPSERDRWFPIVTRIALVMIGFLVGGEFTRERIREHGRGVAAIVVAQGLATAVLVTGGLLAFGVDPTVAVLLGGVATATDPAATKSVVDEARASGRFSRRVLGVVALDDVVGIALFSVLLAVAGPGGGGAEHLLDGAWEILGGALVGLGLGLPGAYLTGRTTPGEPSLEEALGLIFLCSGLTLWLDVSYLFAAVVLGATVANLASHHTRPFREIESIEWPFLTVFFVLAGASIDGDSLEGLGLTALGYVVFRVLGKVGGASLGVRLVGEDRATGRWLGAALLSQAGVALGMALAVADRFPGIAEEVVPVAVVTTVLFELVGPLSLRAALGRADDTVEAE